MSSKVRYDHATSVQGGHVRHGLPYVNNARGKLIHAVRRVNTHKLLGRYHISVHTKCNAGFAGQPSVLALTADPNDGGKLFCKRCFDQLDYRVNADVGAMKVQPIKRSE